MPHSMSDPFAKLADLDRPLRVASLGECMIELSDLGAADGRVAMGVAGDTLNHAIYLARCCAGTSIEVDYLTALGTDQLSQRIIEAIDAEGVGTSNIARLAEKLPGIYAIELDDEGERSFRYWRSQSAARVMLDEGGITLPTLQSYDVLCLSAITLAILSDAARSRLMDSCAQMQADGKVVVFDSNYRPALWRGAQEARDVISAMWKVTTVGLPSRDDEAALWPDETPQQLFARLNLPETALKDGAGGPWLWAGETLPKGSFPAAEQVVDTTSAGDAFNAGYLAGRLRGQTPQQAAQIGHRLASVVIGQNGAIIVPSVMPELF